MDVDQLKVFCAALAGATERDSGSPANVLSYRIHDKKFAYFKTSEPERWRFSFRASPQRFLELTDQSGIKGAKYMHRFCWVTIVNVNAVPEHYLKEWVQWSYHKALSSLSKRVQAQYATQETMQ